jgi:hypothetical protein
VKGDRRFGVQRTCQLLVDSNLRSHRFDVRGVAADKVSRVFEVRVDKWFGQKAQRAQSKLGTHADQEFEANVPVC